MIYELLNDLMLKLCEKGYGNDWKCCNKKSPANLRGFFY